MTDSEIAARIRDAYRTYAGSSSLASAVARSGWTGLAEYNAATDAERQRRAAIGNSVRAELGLSPTFSTSAIAHYYGGPLAGSDVTSTHVIANQSTYVDFSWDPAANAYYVSHSHPPGSIPVDAKSGAIFAEAPIMQPKPASGPPPFSLSLAELPAAFSRPQIEGLRQTIGFPPLVTAPLSALGASMPIVQSFLGLGSGFPSFPSNGGSGGGAGILDVVSAALGAAGSILPAVIANRQTAPSGAMYAVQPYESPEEVGRGAVTGTALETVGGAAPVGWHATRTGFRPNRFITASGALFEHVGRPVLFARDFAAVQRVRSVARRAMRVLGSGGRRRGKGR